jgi:raffinose synthase
MNAASDATATQFVQSGSETSHTTVDVTCSGVTVLTGLPALTTLAPLDGGVLVTLRGEKPSSRLVLPAGSLADLARVTFLRRYEPFWMRAEAFDLTDKLMPETQFLLGLRRDGKHVLVVPLIDGAFRCSLQAASAGGIEVVAESNDLAIATASVRAFFVAVGPDVHDLIEKSARTVNAHIGMGKLRKDKPTPKFLDQFGWCTWDAFYTEVTHEKVIAGLEEFRKGGVQPRSIILDDGWLSHRTGDAGQKMLTTFAPNAQFPEGLAPLVKAAKADYGIETFMVWHAMTGYWGGADPVSFVQYRPKTAIRYMAPGISHYVPNMHEWWGTVIGTVPPEHIYQFFQDFHRYLREQGVDGVKVDVQAQLEMVATGLGGRVKLMQAYREALEGSVNMHFTPDARHGANLINCMSCSAEMLYSTRASTVTRTSTDFWPKRPETHGEHIHTNAHVGLWFGEFVHPDWDMFQSNHEAGAFHAAGRAVSGSPVYVSDKPGDHNFDLLRKLVLPSGYTLRTSRPAVPTADSVYVNPTTENVLYKIFSTNEGELGKINSVALGVFNCRYAPPEATPLGPISGAVSPADLPASVTGAERYALWAHNVRKLSVCKRTETLPITLPSLTAEVLTLVPVDHDLAALGLIEMFNAGGAVVSAGYETPGVYTIRLRAGGLFGAYAASKPKSVDINGKSADFHYDASSKLLTVNVPGPCAVVTITR